MTASVELQGHCSPKFTELRNTFLRQFLDGEEIGARITLIEGGETVVDLWGGWSDLARTKPWNDDTIVCIWSSTKGILATCFAMVVDRGLASYDDKVCKYWPEFAAAGKEDITIGMLLSYQAGLAGFKDPTGIDELFSHDALVARLAAQAPLWKPEPGKAGYHGLTIGMLATELLSRIDGRRMRQFVAEEIAGAYGLDLGIGVDPADVGRVAEMQPIFVDMSWFNDNELQRLAVANPDTPATMSNDPRWYAADLPHANGFAHAQSMARLYDRLLHPGDKPLVGREVLRQATECRFDGYDLVKGRLGIQRWSAGFWLNSPRPPVAGFEQKGGFNGNYGPNPEAYGFSGLGGSFAFADPVADLAFSYTMNRMSDKFDADPRRRNLVRAAYAAF